MKTAIKLVLMCFLAQLLGTLIASPISLLIAYIQSGTVDQELTLSYAMPLGMWLQFFLMAAYLWRRGYLTGDSRLYTPTKISYLALVLLAGAGLVILEDALMHFLQLPDLLHTTFEQLNDSWLGMLCIVVFGPIVEELLFRGAITKVLLRNYNPSTAILLSALLFGLIHINPAQVFGASIVGLLLAWIYWRTGSLIPCMVLHILNNGLSVWFSNRYPEAEGLVEVCSPALYYPLLAASDLLLGVSVWGMYKIQHPLIENK